MKDLLSVCILSYKRRDMLIQCLESLWRTINYPMEIIVGDDTSGNADYLLNCLKDDKISKLILNSGGNRGVGRNLQNCIGVAEGDHILKCDADIIFEKPWAAQCIHILNNNPEITALNLFNYRETYDQSDTRFNIIEELPDCNVVDDFVSSCYMFRRKQIPVEAIPDDGLHGLFYGKKAITKIDLVKNIGFGIPHSVYVTLNDKGEPVKTPTSRYPKIVV